MIIPGILEETFEGVQNKIALLEKEYSLLQIDIADGRLVEGETLTDPELLKKIKTNVKIQVHLMVENPLIYLDGKLPNVESISTQIEAQNVDVFLEKARELGYKVGLSLKPETSTQKLLPYLSRLDHVQFMTVEPGAQGRALETQVLEKIAQFRKENPDIVIQADGGINKENIKNVLNTGVNNVVIGSAINQF